MSATATRTAEGPRLRLRLYIAGESPNSVVAVANLRAALAALGASFDDVEIVDVLKTPERGLRDGVLVTPMLVRSSPLPERRVLGNLSNRRSLDGVLSGPGVDHE